MAAIASGTTVSNPSNADTNTYTTGAFAASAAGNLVLLACVNTKATRADEMNSITLGVAGAVTNIRKIADVGFNTIATPLQRLNLWCGLTTTTSVQINMNFPATQTGGVWFVQEYTNVNVKAGINGVRWPAATYATDTTTTAMSVNSITPLDTHNAQVAFYNINGNQLVTAKAGWTEAFDNATSIAPISEFEVQTIFSNDPLSTGTLGTAAVFGAILVELISVDAQPRMSIPPLTLLEQPPSPGRQVPLLVTRQHVQGTPRTLVSSQVSIASDAEGTSNNVTRGMRGFW